MNIIEQIEAFDRQLFLKINGMHQPWLDQAMYYMSEAVVWIPVYLILLYLIARTYDRKVMLWSLLGVALVITLGDRISVELFKEVFMRYRPTHNLEIGDLVHTVNGYRGGKYSFVSSHATNFFGIATFVSLLIRKKFPKAIPWIILWAALIGYTRVYLGVHYPADVACGTLLGILIGYLVYRLFKFLLLDRIEKSM